MEKTFLFLSITSLRQSAFFRYLERIGIDEKVVVFLSETQAKAVLDDKEFAPIDATLSLLHVDLKAPVSCLVAHADNDFCRRLAREALSYFPNRASFPSDIILKEVSFLNQNSFADLARIFGKVPSELLLTAGAYLRCGMDASLGAESLYIHRNTFLYRLNHFIEMTGIDIRDYHNALLLELYFQLGNGLR